jgi:hypothetical protein
MAPAVAHDSLLARVRPSCAALVAREDALVHINEDKVRAFVEQLDAEEFEKLAEPMNFPLNFRSQQEELNFLSAWGGCGCKSNDTRLIAIAICCCRASCSAVRAAELWQRLPQGPAQVRGSGRARHHRECFGWIMRRKEEGLMVL